MGCDLCMVSENHKCVCELYNVNLGIFSATHER